MGNQSKCEPHGETIRAMHANGASFTQIAGALGLEYEHVYRWSRRRGMAPHTHPTTVDLKSKHKQIAKLRRDGLSCAQVAEKTGYKEFQIRHYCGIHGLTKFGMPRVNLGKISKGHFEPYQLKELQRLSLKWGTPNIAETLAEIARDFVEAEIAKHCNNA